MQQDFEDKKRKAEQKSKVADKGKIGTNHMTTSFVLRIR